MRGRMGWAYLLNPSMRKRLPSAGYLPAGQRAHAHLVTEGMTAGSGYALKAVRVVDYASRMLSVHASTADLASIARRILPSRLRWAWSMRRRLLLVWCRICWCVVPTAFCTRAPPLQV